MENRVNQIAQFITTNQQGRKMLAEALKLGFTLVGQEQAVDTHEEAKAYYLNAMERAYVMAADFESIYDDMFKAGIMDEALYQESTGILAKKEATMALLTEKLDGVSTDLAVDDYFVACAEAMNSISQKDLGYSDEMTQLTQDTNQAVGVALNMLGETGGLYELAVEAGLGEDAELFKVAA